MNIVLVYFWRGGNTRKIAEAIAEELEIAPLDRRKEIPNISNAQLLIVGAGTYGDKPGKEMISYLENLNPVTNRRADLFFTCAGYAFKTLASMMEIMINKGYNS